MAGDLLTLAVVTVIGFASHQTLGTAGKRILATLIPSLIAWLAVAPFLGAYDRARAVDLRQLWRPVWAMILAAPLAAVLRGFWLGAPVMPIFAAVMGGVSAAGILIWRLLYAWLSSRLSPRLLRRNQ
jgi:hypothetical protein